MKKIEKQTIANYLHNLRVAYSGGKTLREFCKEHNFDASLWSMLENGLWHEFTAEEILEKYPPLFPHQEVSQPEETVVSGSYSTKDIRVSEEYLNTTNYQDYPKTSTTTNKVENNTEEWREMESEDWKTILTRYYSDLEDSTIVRSRGKIRNLIEFIEQIILQTSFDREELETLKQIVETHDGHKVGYEALKDIGEKVDRLLSLSK